ncbi:hypothetical protein SOMG_04042 [Schizosaccharomyces osmophilus]|uniref:Uncharacterized protein n=1 Tax=Schizosaccharomyces osmophilus TaxID=2545709 RepID=A0AAE9WDV1_9SCHI|nr:uncharacterized protein SOMG_04042 [Schizosaccharomyces osmophilus]WBW73809.1 hypothetical protein SOMG_04042 [Schizosaccharomyces osmophilus]
MKKDNKPREKNATVSAKENDPKEKKNQKKSPFFYRKWALFFLFSSKSTIQKLTKVVRSPFKLRVDPLDRKGKRPI